MSGQALPARSQLHSDAAGRSDHRARPAPGAARMIDSPSPASHARRDSKATGPPTQRSSGQSPAEKQPIRRNETRGGGGGARPAGSGAPVATGGTAAASPFYDYGNQTDDNQQTKQTHSPASGAHNFAGGAGSVAWCHAALPSRYRNQRASQIGSWKLITEFSGRASVRGISCTQWSFLDDDRAVLQRY